jgi:hypothetical protein
LSTGTRVASFRDAVRERDGGCVITGRRAISSRGAWVSFESSHIFPLAHEGHWNAHDYGRWITIPSPQGGSINSVQNGLLLACDIHALFDSYDVSINPDVNMPDFPWKY